MVGERLAERWVGGGWLVGWRVGFGWEWDMMGVGVWKAESKICWGKIGR